MVQREAPLKGKTVVITRPKAQAKEIVESIRALGGNVILLPMVEVKTIYDRRKFSDFYRKLADGRIDYVVFMSVNGVKSLIDISKRFRMKMWLLGAIKNTFVVAVGDKTAARLRLEGIDVKIVPREFSSKGIVEELSNANLIRKQIYVVRTSASGNYLRDRLSKYEALVSEYYVYGSRRPKVSKALKSVVNKLLDDDIWAIVFTSPSTVENFLVLSGRLIDKRRLIECLNRAVVAAIGPVTSSFLAKEGVQVDVMPKRYLSLDLVEDLGRYAKAGLFQECSKV
jgi:uroporphyrinogen-III synthase